MSGRKIVQIIPGGGWRAVYTEEDDNGKEVEEASPVVCFALYSDGDVEALDADESGWIDVASEVSNFVKLLPPDGENWRREAVKA